MRGLPRFPPLPVEALMCEPSLPRSNPSPFEAPLKPLGPPPAGVLFSRYVQVTV